MIERDRLMQCSDGACTEARDRVPLQARRVIFDGDRVCGCVRVFVLRVRVVM
jgi:hypothetical protein